MIAEVTRMGNMRKAFARVEASAGMAGVDRETIRDFGSSLDLNLGRLAYEMESGEYRPYPMLRFLVEKRGGKSRPLVVPCVRDRVAQASVLNVLEPVFEAEFEDFSHGYRKGRSVKSAARQIRDYRDKGFRFVVEVDIVAYFDSIDHRLLYEKLKTVVQDRHLMELFRLWVESEVYDGQKVFVMEKGVPQGSVVSPMLANLFLDEFDEAMATMGFIMVRYADDFVILAKTRERAARALELTDAVLKTMRLQIDEEDTRLTSFDDGFQIPGPDFRQGRHFPALRQTQKGAKGPLHAAAFRHESVHGKEKGETKGTMTWHSST